LKSVSKWSSELKFIALTHPPLDNFGYQEGEICNGFQRQLPGVENFSIFKKLLYK
jgi:hypothetical protein